MRRRVPLLVWFWVGLLVLLTGGAGVLQWLGPPPRPVARIASAAPSAPRAALPPLVAPRSTDAGGTASPPPVPPKAAVSVPAQTGDAAGPAPIPAPQPGLEEASATYRGSFLPRISDDRRSPMQVYAAAANLLDRRPRIAILVAGIGMSASESEDAIQTLPPAVSLAVSPYAYKPGPLLAQARARGHEYLLSIPMEPQGYPLDDPGNRALMTGNSEAENLKLLDWALTRFGGYVGATGALGRLRGERFAASTPQVAPVLAELAKRGLLYIDPRPGAARPKAVVGRSVDVIIDEPAVRREIDAKLEKLERIAHDRGSAIGLAGLPEPVTVDRIAAWANTLPSRGFALMPVTAVAPIVPPPEPSLARTLTGAPAP